MPTNLLKEDLPSNSFSKRASDERRLERITTSPVYERKRGSARNFVENFFGQDAENIGSYLLWDVFIPAAKDTLSEIVSTGIEMLLFGEKRSSSSSHGKKSYDERTVVSYGSFFPKKDRGRGSSGYSKASHFSINEIIFQSRADADEVLSALLEIIDTEGSASVGDLYDLIGRSSDFTAEQYGWENLSRASIRRLEAGYYLNLPKPVAIE